MDVRTDLFSLGMTLWFLTEGRAPEGGSSAEIAASRLNRESYAARLPANLPLPFREVLGRLLEKDRKNRFATAADVFKSLNACAAALGFRRARDYTEPAAVIEWEDTETPDKETLDSAKVEPIEIETVDAPLSSEFNIVARINEDFTGLNYIAEDLKRKGAKSILHVLHPLLLEDVSALDCFRLHFAQLIRTDVAEIVRPTTIKRYSDYVAVISDKPGGTDLLSVLRTERTVPLIAAAPLLGKIADACDALCAAGLPGVQLAPGRISVEWTDEVGPTNSKRAQPLSTSQVRLFPRFLAVKEAPELARLNEPEDASSTMTTDMLGDPARADNMPEHFATLLYRVVAGRNCPIAASLSTQAYVAIPGLSEQSNRILAMVIARQVEDSSCGKVLREVLNAEGIRARVPDHFSAGFTTRPGSSTVSPLATPPSTPVERTPATARSWKPPAVSTPTPTPIVTKAVPPTVLVTPSPVAVPPSVATPPVARQSPAAEPATQLPVLRQETPAAPPPSLPKERAADVADVAEVKTDSPRVIETRVPPPETAVREIVKLEIAPAPVEARTKEPTPEKLSATVETRPKKASAPVARQERKIEELKKPADTPPTAPKPREEVPVAAATKISPPPVEKPMLITPKILPAPVPEVPIIREASPIEINEEPEPWDLRKLKPIAIGIAALLAVSLSYVGVKALTKAPVKSQTTNHPNTMLVDRPLPAAVQVAKTSESAVPQVATARETAASAPTNPVTEPEAGANTVPPNQSPETVALAPTNPAPAPNSMQHVGPPNQDAMPTTETAHKQDAVGQSPLFTQPAQPQIAPKPEQENASNASRRTRSADTSTRTASSGQAAASKSSGAGHSVARSSSGRPANPAPQPPAQRAPVAPKAPRSEPAHRPAFEGGVPGG
jgi:hypothetical protein